LDELYDYVYDRVRSATPNQTPGKWAFDIRGDLFIARRARPVSTPAPLPAGLQEATDSPFVEIRAGAVGELTRLLRSRHAGLALAARLTLQRLADDDSRKVSAAATAALSPGAEPAAIEPVSSRLAPSAALEPATTTPSEAAPAASGRTRPRAQPKKTGQGQTIKIVHVSDISGKEADEHSLGRLVVHEHPEYADLPVTLEVLPEEVESLEDGSRFVAVEWIPPGARLGKRIALSLEEFNVLAAQGVMESAIQDALIAKYRTRPRAGGGIDYSSPEHAGEPHRGRITDAEKAYVREHLDQVNARLRAAGMREIDPNDAAMRDRYGLG
jgi:hypothetical protein